MNIWSWIIIGVGYLLAGLLSNAIWRHANRMVARKRQADYIVLVAIFWWAILILAIVYFTGVGYSKAIGLLERILFKRKVNE